MLKAKERSEKIAKDALGNAKGLKEPLDTALNENKELKQKLSNYARDKALLAVSNHFYSPDIILNIKNYKNVIKKYIIYYFIKLTHLF